MPVVYRLGGLRVMIWPNDHRPAHVHVKGAQGEAVFYLNCPDGPPELRDSNGFNGPDIIASVTCSNSLLVRDSRYVCEA